MLSISMYVGYGTQMVNMHVHYKKSIHLFIKHIGKCMWATENHLSILKKIALKSIIDKANIKKTFSQVIGLNVFILKP